jgi:hypothetical protein
MLIFLLFEAVWLRWSFLGAVALFIVVLLGIAYVGSP